MRNFYTFLLGTLLLTLSSCSDSNDTSTKHKLTIGTNAEFPPYTFKENGTMKGFEIDLSKEIARRLNREIEFVNIPFDALISEVIAQNVDFVAAGMSYTKERAELVAYTEPYLYDDLLVIVSFEGAEEYTSLEELKGKRVVVNKGYTSDAFMSQQEGIELIRLRNTYDGFASLMKKRADAFVTPYSTLKDFLSSTNSQIFEISPIPGTADNCAIILPKNKESLLTELQGILDAMEKDKTIHKLKTHWGLS